MKASVYSLKKVLFEGDASSINVRTAAGEITVLDHHRPLISALVPGTMKIVAGDKREHFLPIGGGFLEVTDDNRVRLIVDEA